MAKTMSHDEFMAMKAESSKANAAQTEATTGPAKAWYVLRAISGKEAKVKEVLDAAMRNTDWGRNLFQVLIPTEKIVTVKNGKKVIKERNLYSGYVFVEAILYGDVIHELRNTTNVIDFLGKRGKTVEPEALHEAEVMRMLGRADELSGQAEDGMGEYLVGEIVKVIDGAFNGFTGEIVEIDREKKKLRVMVKIFDRPTPLELEHTKVEKV